MVNLFGNKDALIGSLDLLFGGIVEWLSDNWELARKRVKRS